MASEDPSIPGQQARVMMAFVESIEQHGAMSPRSHQLLWETSGEALVERQVEDLVRLIQRPGTAAVDEVERNLMARAKLLVDLELLSPAVYMGWPRPTQRDAELVSSSPARCLVPRTSPGPICGRFPDQKVCGCTIPCRRSLRTVTLDEVRPGLFIGPLQAAYLDDELRARRVTHVLNLSGSIYFERPFLTYRAVDLDDDSDAASDFTALLPECLAFISEGLAGGGGVLVHCVAGKSRSASVCAAWLVATEGFSADTAIAEVQAARPRADPNSGFRAALRNFHEGQSQPRVAGRPGLVAGASPACEEAKRTGHDP